jgi:DNA-binding CsgD family transcriptional regulator
MELIVLGGLAVVEENEGAAQSAEKYYREVIDLWRQGEDRHDAIAAMCAAATFFAAQGFEKETALCAEALAAIASATGNPEALAALAYTLGETALLHGNAEEAARQFMQALAHMEKLEIPMERAKFEYRTGFALARANSKEAAIEHLRNAYRLARKLGARPLAGKIADELNALGETAEERRNAEATARANHAGLTQRQLEIARLMASGLTNKEIAQKLFLSPRTVDMHVSHLLNRLDCRTRTEAVTKAGELGLLR